MEGVIGEEKDLGDVNRVQRLHKFELEKTFIKETYALGRQTHISREAPVISHPGPILLCWPLWYLTRMFRGHCLHVY